MAAKTMIEQHENECGRRYGELNETLRTIRSAQVENAANTQAMGGVLQGKIDNVGKWVGKIVLGVAGSLIMGLTAALWTIFAHKFGL